MAAMTDAPASEASGRHEHVAELRKEACTMALYVGICLLAAFISVVGYAVARGGGATRPRALAYALAVLVIAVAIAEVKNVLAGH
jgi:hypothetical protein